MTLFVEGRYKLILNVNKIEFVDDSTFIVNDEYKIQLSIISDTNVYEIMQVLYKEGKVHLINVSVERIKES